MKVKDFRLKVANIPLDFDDYEVFISSAKTHCKADTVNYNTQRKQVILYKK